MLILCDFDGTITEVDVTDLLWNGRIAQAERVQMVEEVNCGRWTMHQYMAHGYAWVPESPSYLLNDLRSRVRMREGWKDFLQIQGASNDQLHVVSNGLDFYIREFVPESIPISSFVARYDGRYRVDLPHGCVLLPGEEFKANRVRQLAADSALEHAVYIGSGRADFTPALFCDTVFAVRGSQLAQLRQSYSLPAIEFDSFETVTEFILSASSQRPCSGHIHREFDGLSNWVA